MGPLNMSSIVLKAAERRASDVHLSCGRPVFFRIDGVLLPDESSEPLGSETLMGLLSEILGADALAGLKMQRELDCAFEIKGIEQNYRYRLNCYWSLGRPAAAIRLIPWNMPALDGLGLPEQLKSICQFKKGLFLVAGPSGSGKSTTLAAMVRQMDEGRRAHIITLEDPVEFIHRPKNSLIHQREIGRDCATFPEGLRRALRQDPDVLVIGEMRDSETIAAAVTAAETGHLVLATLHTQDASQAVDRIIDAFPPSQQTQVRCQLSLSLIGVCSQQLVPAVGGGRIAAVELLIGTNAVKSAIREGKTSQIGSLIQTGSADGMRTMEQSLASLVRRGMITEEDALSYAFVPVELQRLLSGSRGRP